MVLYLDNCYKFYINYDPEFSYDCHMFSKIQTSALECVFDLHFSLNDNLDIDFFGLFLTSRKWAVWATIQEAKEQDAKVLKQRARDKRKG